MALNYRKNSITCTTENYPNLSDLNGPGICGSNRINIRTGGSTQYIGLVAPGHDQASDLSVRVGSNNLRMAKLSKFTTCTYGWGRNAAGQLGDNSTVNRSVPIFTCCNHVFCCIAVGDQHTLALRTDGTLWAWGSNVCCQLGDGTALPRCIPVPVCVSGTFCSISAGSYSSYAIRTDGTAVAWGNNFSGQLGDNTCTTRPTPVAVCGNLLFSCITGGESHVIALRTDGTAWAWGNGLNGQLGDGTTSQRRITPVAVCCNYTFCVIAAGGNHSLGIRTDGCLFSWGANCVGQLGDGTCVNKCLPVSVCGGNLFTSVTGGFIHTIGLRTNGTAVAWGGNSSGQLGNGVYSLANTTPVAVCCNCIFYSISAGSEHSLALRTDRTAVAWGNNTGCQLGDGTASCKNIPVAVCCNYKFYLIAAGGVSSLAISCQWLSPATLTYPSNYVLPLISTSVSYTPTLTNLSGTVTYSISPSLPAGLNFNTSNGVISGTTPSSTNDTVYTVTASSSFGSVSTNIRIRIVFVNTTFTNVDFTNSISGTLSTGYWTRGNGLTSTISDRNFRGSLINGLFWATNFGNTFWYTFGFEVSTSFPDTDTGFFRKITLGNNEVLRSRSHNFINSSYTNWSFEVSTGSGTREAFPFPVPQNGQTQTLIIE